jgi:polyhydroxybutyrate depolymerase
MQERLRTVLMLILLAGQSMWLPTAMAQEGARDGPVRQWLKERMIERRQSAPAPTTANEVRPRIDRPGDYDFAIVHDGRLRKFRVHLPASYQRDHPAPMLLSFHGGGGDMNYQASDTNYGQISASEKHGFVAVFPNGFSRFDSGKFATWNAGKCCAGARDENVDDVGFVRRILTEVTGQLNIDKARIYASGMSNGGMMTYRLACEMSDVFKGIASVAGTDNTISCAPKAAISVLHIHARNDDHVLFDGGAGAGLRDASKVTDFRSVPSTISRWVEFNGCSRTPRRVLDRPGAYCDRYDGCRDGVRVQLCVTETGAHSWPGGTKTRGSESTSKAISANDVMWDFFSRP